jgi:hypothetical protein
MNEKVMHVIGLGDREDFEAGRGSVYWIKAPNGENALPVFTTPEKAHRYWKANSGVRDRLDMAENGGLPTTHQGPLLQNRITILSLKVEGLALAADLVEADYLLKDPRPGAEQEILRLERD